MPTTTATWKLTYPAGSDRLCDSPIYIEALADEVDAFLVTYNAFLDRILTPPYASLRATVPQTYPSFILPAGTPTLDVQYDTVNADTGNYTNLPATPGVIITDFTDGVSDELPDGIYLWGQYAYMQQDNSAPDTGYYQTFIQTISPSFNNPPGGVTFEDGGSPNVYMGSTYFAPRQLTSANGRVVMYTQVGNNNAVVGGVTTVKEGAFFFLWIGDN